MKHIEKYIALLLLLFAVGFNLYIYRLEPSAKVDPNDNTFQFALVDRTNQIWDFADKKCSGIFKPICMYTYLSDHWVPNWAEGYNLPYYYSHVPQIVIVSSHKAVSRVTCHASRLIPFLSLGTCNLSLFSYYHIITYLLLSVFPISLFLGFLIIGASPLTAGVAALIASQLSTDGLYGLDPPSFLWRGYGLTSQLYAMSFMPLAVAYAFRLFRNNEGTNKRSYIFPILFLTMTTAGHLGIGIMAFLSVAVIAIAPTIQAILTNQWDRSVWKNLRQSLTQLLLVFGGVGLLLGYWIVPIMLNGNFHNTSVWDPIWKFDSYGYREVLKNFFNGDLFDFHRFPTLTILVLIGLFHAAGGKIFAARFPSFIHQDQEQTKLASSGARKLLIPQQGSYFSLALLFVFWIAMYFGTTTWGRLLYLIPGMSDFHISRFIVGVHIAGLFLIPLGLDWLASRLPVPRSLGVVGLLCIVILLISPQTLSYASYNDVLIKQANTNYDAAQSDINLLLTTLRRYEASSPGRVFAGRGGSWGKKFRIAETPLYMHLSTYGIPTVLWLPETWSPNSDTEQYFRENVEADYALYNIQYIVTPVDLTKDQIQPFWKPLMASTTWKLYSVGAVIPSAVEGYITTGVRPAIVSTTKLTYTNIVHLWIQSDFPKLGLYPELTFDRNYPKTTGLPNFRMTDGTNYKIPNGSLHNLFAEAPTYGSPTGEKVDISSLMNIRSQSNDHDMAFTATVVVKPGCEQCIVVLKQSAHPSWHATIDGKPVSTMIVFPFYTAVKVDAPGTHTIVFSYEPSGVKIVLLILSMISLGYLVWRACLATWRAYRIH